jgi:hypothetical protein
MSNSDEGNKRGMREEEEESESGGNNQKNVNTTTTIRSIINNRLSNNNNTSSSSTGSNSNVRKDAGAYRGGTKIKNSPSGRAGEVTKEQLQNVGGVEAIKTNMEKMNLISPIATTGSAAATAAGIQKNSGGGLSDKPQEIIHTKESIVAALDANPKRAIRSLPFDLKTYGPSRINHIYKKSGFWEVFNCWAKLAKSKPFEEVKISEGLGSICAAKDSTDPTASNKKAVFELNFWQTKEDQVLVELILLTDDALDTTWDSFFDELKNDPVCSSLN